MVLFWYKCAMFNISVNQSQFALFMVNLKKSNFKSDEEKPDTNTFWRTLANELITFTWSFISI